MNTLTELSNPPSSDTAAADSAPFFIRGKVVEGADSIQRSRDLGVNFATPKLELDSLVHPRTELPPLLNTPLSEIIDFLVEAGQRMCDGKNPYVEACIDRMAKGREQGDPWLEAERLVAAIAEPRAAAAFA